MAKPADSFDWTDKSVLVTGGAGFIGSHLVELLTEASAQVTVFDTLGSGRRENLAGVADDVTLLEYDVRDVDWEAYFSQNSTDVVFHFAANAYVPPSVESPSFDYETNFAATFRLLEALRRSQWPGRMVFASSAAVSATAAAASATAAAGTGFLTLPQITAPEGLTTNLFTIDSAVYKSAMIFFDVSRGTTVEANGWFSVQFKNGAWREIDGPYSGDDTNMFWTISVVGSVVTVQALVNVGAGDAKIIIKQLLFKP